MLYQTMPVQIIENVVNSTAKQNQEGYKALATVYQFTSSDHGNKDD